MFRVTLRRQRGTGGGSGGGGAGGGDFIDTHDGGLCTDTWENYGQAFFVTNCTGCHEHDHSNFVLQPTVKGELGLIEARLLSKEMPKNATLADEERQRILTFLACGANSGALDAGVPFEAASARAAVAKVKNFLVGLPPTDAEVQAVATDQQALAGLITEWMKLPQYDDKMTVFFSLAFQQTQITASNFVDFMPTNGLGSGIAVPLLVQNARESFARTVVALNAEGRPLTEAFTTTRIMMTPALMELYAFLDMRVTDDNGKTTDLIDKPVRGATLVIGKAAGPIPIEDSLNPKSPNFMHWYHPDVGSLKYPDPSCNSDPITMSARAYNLHDLMYGAISDHAGPNGNCPPKPGTLTAPQMQPADFTTWKLVTVRGPKAGEALTQFYDLPTLRSTTELVLRTPHPGFFSTPAFFANWPTNTSNQMRVTANQALIVATGMQVDGLDATATPLTPGIDAAHSATTDCFACHRILDPTRSILASTYSWVYTPQTDTNLTGEKGRFQFQGVNTPVSTIDDFGGVLAHHPAVGAAWAQKLCYAVNSAPCAPSDPEFQRVVKAFADSNFAWATLVQQLLGSPLVTNLKASDTNAVNGEVISVSRRDHLCAALNDRLGLNDVCGLTLVLGKKVGVGTVPQIVAGMPSDGYGRGATIPVLPNDPTLFYRAAAENVCAQVAGVVIDAAVDPNQPNAKHWSSTQSDAAIADFVTTLVGLGPADPNAAAVSDLLHAHYNEALKTTTKTNALKSTFVTACLSPTFIGVGL